MKCGVDLSLPPAFRIKNNKQKYLLKKVSEKYLPDSIINRPKAPFSSPMRSWLRGELKEMVGDVLSEESVRKRGIYNSSYVQRIIKENSSGLDDHSHTIWKLLTNELWFRRYFDK